MSDRDDRRGWTSKELTVWCGKCAEWHQESAGMAVAYWKAAGWTWTRKHGWMCPACSKAIMAGGRPA